MTQSAAPSAQNSVSVGIGFMLIAVLVISVNDMLIKKLSGGYPLHEMVFFRSIIGLPIVLWFVHLEGGFAQLRAKKYGFLFLQGGFLVIANILFFMGLAALPLAEATALFFAAPLMITLLSVPFLKERVGPFRLGAVLIGFAGVIVMLRPWEGEPVEGGHLVLMLPVLAAACYAARQIVTRKLGMTVKASVMTVYLQVIFLFVSLGFFLVAGDGRYAQGLDNPSLHFVLREWVWPEGNDIYLFLLLGICSGVGAYSFSKAYSSADVAVVAPFEYLGLPIAVLFGWMFWGEWPDSVAGIGMLLILAGGLIVFLRERHLNRKLTRMKRV